MRDLIRWAIAISATLFAFHSHAEAPPKNPFLADSPWPMSHQGPYAQGSSSYPGPTSNSL